MKKLMIITAIIIVIISIGKEQKVVIPKEAIRFRVIASSNTKADQDLKKKVTTNVYHHLSTLSFVDINQEEAKEEIKSQIPKIDNIVSKTLEEANLSKEYHINYGLNYFPEKEYKGVIYKEGKYESLVVTLGDGLGDNFWCVLFPPLCLLETDESKTSDVKYTSFIKEVIEKYF